MDIVIPLYDRFTALDAVGPYEVLSRLPGARVTFAAVEPRPYTTETGMLTLGAERRSRLPAPGRDRGARRARSRAAMSATSASWTGSARRTRPPSGRHRCAPARCCSAPPACSTVSRPPPTGSTCPSSSASARCPRAPRGGAGQGDHRRRGVLRNRHGAHARGADRGRGRGEGDPAGYRVRPRAAVRLRLHADRLAGDDRARAPCWPQGRPRRDGLPCEAARGYVSGPGRPARPPRPPAPGTRRAAATAVR